MPTEVWADDVVKQSDANGYVQFSTGGEGYSNYGFNIMFDPTGQGNYLKTTYNNKGYETYIQVGNNSKALLYSSGAFEFGKTFTNNGIQVKIYAEIPAGENVKTIAIKYVIKNTTNSDLEIKLGSCADTQIASNDKAAISIENGNTIIMKDGTASEYRISAGSAAFTTLWYGYYSDRQSNVFTDVRNDANYSYSGDSGLAWSWTITVPAGKTIWRYAGGGEEALSSQTCSVVMDDYTYGGTPSTPSVPDAYENPDIDYYYNTTNSNTSGTPWTGMNGTSLNAGTYYMYAQIDATQHYAAFTTDPVPFTVNQKEVTLSWGDTDFTYNRSAQKPTATAGNLVNSDVCTVTVTGEQTNAGNYTATATALSNTNYKLPSSKTKTFNIGKKSVTVSGITASDKEYDGNTSATLITTGAAFGGLINGDALTVSATGTFADKDVGPGKTVTLGALTLGGTSVDNYQLAETGNQASTTADITARALTITAEAKSKTYGDSDPTLTYTSSGLVGGDNITGALSREAGENVGTYPIAQGSLTAGDNYSITYTGANLTIGKANLTVTANPKTIIYGEEPANNDVTYSGFVNSETEGVLNGTLDYAYNYAQYGNVGEYTITPSGLTSGNYAINFVAGTLTVDKREVTLSWGDTDFTYNRSAQKPTATAGNLVNSDKCTVTVTGEQTNAGSYTATASALSNTNYKLPSSTIQAFSIGKKNVTVSDITASDKVYDGTTSATVITTGASFGGLIEGDELTVSTTGTFADKDVGPDKTVTLGTLTLGGTSVGNYQLAETGNQASTTADITAKALTITADAKSKTYGDADPSLTYTSSELVDGDEITGLLSREEGEDVGTYAITQGSLTAGGNYTVSYTGANLTIGQKTLTITASPQTITYGESIETGIGQVTQSGLVDGDALSSITLAKTATNYSATAYVGNITPSEAVVMRGENVVTTNYDITYTPGDLTIGKATLTATVQNEEREVGSVNPTFTVEYTGFVNDEDENVLTTAPTFECTADADSPVGTYAITPSGAVADNYDFTYVPGTLTIYRNFAFTNSDWMTWYGAEDLTVDDTKMETYVVTEVTSTTITIESTHGEIYLDTPMLLKRVGSDPVAIHGYAPAAALTPPTGLSAAYIGGVSSFEDYTLGTVYVLAGSEFIRAKVTASTDFSPSKCFIYIIASAGSRLYIAADGDATDMRAIDNAMEETWYTLDGRKLDTSPKRAGVYIRNGKKVIVK